jgi:glucosamine-phosphate N-acetyltransferase
MLSNSRIHACGIVGHIEDVAVLKDEQGKGLGRRLVEAMDTIGKQSGAYKNILNCTDSMRSYYASCGYADTGHMMVSNILSQALNISADGRQSDFSK